MPNTPRTTEALDALRQIEKTQEQIGKEQATLREEILKLRDSKTPGTVVFFDLTGSTGYRQRYGAEAGLMKAFLHNRTVSRAIADAGGRVVKWMGDGVLGAFADDQCGPEHPVKGLSAALSALRTLKSLQAEELLFSLFGSTANGHKKKDDHEIHTKIAICSGLLHFFDFTKSHSPDSANATESLAAPTLAADEPGGVCDREAFEDQSSAFPPGAARDPMGSCVDLASRLSHLAEADAILIDEPSFWGYQPTDDQGNPLPVNPIPGICQVPKDKIRWRPLTFPLRVVRETVYVPRITGLLIGQDGSMKACRSFLFAGGAPVSKDECLKSASQDVVNGHSDHTIVFALDSVPCNVAGFERPVKTLALTLTPHEQPIKHSVHAWNDPTLKEVRADAERSYRMGGDANAEQADQKYRQVLSKDPRNFEAHLRLAMIARAKRKNQEAMDHLMAAKESDPDCPLAWAVAGMTHLDEAVRNKCDRSDALVRAITGFTRAKKLAANRFYGLLEQYSTSLLAISHFLRLLSRPDGRPDAEGDLERGKTLVDELTNWPPKNFVARYAIRVADIFLGLAQNQRDRALQDVQELLPQVEKQDAGREEAADLVPYDHVVLLKDIRNLLVCAQMAAQTE